MGQVDSESVGDMQISGIGGQVNFVKGAINSVGGKSIIAMPSTTADGKISKIVPVLSEGSVVTTLRTDVDYIITGVWYCKNDRAYIKAACDSVIDIAHPKFRDELIEAFEKRFHTKFDPYLNA